MQHDLFDAGRPPPPSGYTPKKPCTAAPIGSGPAGETCRTCLHYVVLEYSKTYRKCGLMEAHWTKGPGTDIKAGWAACRMWEAKE